MAKVRLAVRVLVPLLAVASAGCLSLLGLESIEYTEADASAIDGALPGVEAATDAPPDQIVPATDASDAGDGSSRGCYDRYPSGYDGGAVIFCDDFERTTAVDDGWKPMAVQNGGALSISSEASTSGTRSLLVELPVAGTNKRAYLRTLDLPSGTAVSYLEADVKLDMQPPVTGSYPSDAFTLVQATNISNGFKAAFVRTPAAGMFNPIFFVSDAEVDLPSAEWAHLTWLVDPVNQTLTMVKRGTSTGATRTTGSPQPIKDYWIGAEIETSGGPVRLFVDDIVVHR